MLSVLAWGHQACNTVGISEVFMSPDSDENGRRWVNFSPAAKSINCIARIATGRNDITMRQKIVEYNVDKETGAQTTPKRIAGLVEFRPEPGIALSLQTLTITSVNQETGDPVPFPIGSFRCEIFSDNGDLKFGASPLRAAKFTIDYVGCPEEGVATGEPCTDTYGPGASKQCKVSGGGDSDLCTCNAISGWICKGGTAKLGGPLRAKDAGTN